MIARRLVNNAITQGRQRFAEFRARPNFPPFIEQRGPPSGDFGGIRLEAKTGVAEIAIAGSELIYM